MARQGPHTGGALGRGGSKGNHPGLNRNSISQARRAAAPVGECTLEEPLHIPMGGFLLLTYWEPYSYLSVYYPNLKNNNNERGIFSVWLRSAVLLQDGNPTGPFQSRLQAEETLGLVLL